MIKLNSKIFVAGHNEQYNYNYNYKCLMPSNIFGLNDNYHQINSHFFPALIRKVHELKLNMINQNRMV